MKTMKQKAVAICSLTAVIGLVGCTTQQSELTQSQVDRIITNQERSLDIIAKLVETPKGAAPVATTTVSTAAKPDVTTKQPAVGRLRSIGSDTMDNLMEYWKADFSKTHSRVSFYHQGRGSSTAIPALVEGKAEIGPMSRKIKDSEVAYFQKKFGYAPIQVRVAVDAVAVYVHPDNPFAKMGMTFAQLQAVFGQQGKQAKTWGDLGATGTWAQAPIHVFGRNSASGTHSFFKATVLGKDGNYAETCKALAGSEQLVKTISADPFAIGYSGIGYLNDSVVALSLSASSASDVYPPDMQYAYSGEYPLARFLYLTVNRKPNTLLSPITHDFLSYIFSKEGQQRVTDDGFFPVSSKIINEEKTKLGI
jgi:phosphate transport system substrate-binding protein